MAETKIKLVQVIADSKLGGGPKHVLGLLKYIDKKLFDVHLVCPPGYLSAEAKLIHGVEVHNFHPRSKFDIFAIFALRHIFNQIRSNYDPFGPMIIHSHGPRAGMMARAASPFGVKKVYTEHIYDENYHLKNPITESIQRWVIQRQNRRTNLIIAVSSSVKKFLIQSGMAAKDKIELIPNAIDLLNVRENKQSFVGAKSFIIGTIGNLNFQKGHIYLVEAMPEVIKSFPLATLEIIGEGEERPILEDKIKKLNLERHITLLGQKTQIAKYLKHWDVFALPSISETFGISILEAMSYQVPVVASKVGGIPDVIINGKNGLLVESANSKALATAIIKLLSSHSLSASFKREGLARAKQFAWDRVIKDLESAYLKLFEY